MSIKIPKSIAEFEHTYYYKTDLLKICKLLSLPASGTKLKNRQIAKYILIICYNNIKKKLSAIK